MSMKINIVVHLWNKIVAKPVQSALDKISPETAYFNRLDCFNPRYFLASSIVKAALMGPHILIGFFLIVFKKISVLACTYCWSVS